jgi:uncharacterized protein YdeI (BOF family)
MSVRKSVSCTPLLLVLAFSLATLLATSAQANSPRVGAAWSVEQIRSSAKEGGFVTMRGQVVSISRGRFFMLEDTAGGKIIVDIPDYLTRDLGTPNRGETIAVSGKFDHKKLLDSNKSKSEEPGKNWGIRVSALDRNIETSGRNPNAPDAASPETVPTSSNVPAAPLTTGTLATPNTPKDLKARLSAARQKALAARDDLGDANASHARGLHQKLDATKMTTLAADQKRAQDTYNAAISAVRPLVDEARESGVDPKLLELYEAGITGPPR